MAWKRRAGFATTWGLMMGWIGDVLGAEVGRVSVGHVTVGENSAVC